MTCQFELDIGPGTEGAVKFNSMTLDR